MLGLKEISMRLRSRLNIIDLSDISKLEAHGMKSVEEMLHNNLEVS